MHVLVCLLCVVPVLITVCVFLGVSACLMFVSLFLCAFTFFVACSAPALCSTSCSCVLLRVRVFYFVFLCSAWSCSRVFLAQEAGRIEQRKGYTTQVAAHTAKRN